MKIINLQNTNIKVWDTKEPIGVIQILHGAMEHIARYEQFVTVLNNNGYIVIGYDLIGHGELLKDNIHHINSKEQLIAQSIEVNSYIKKNYTLPLIVLGHSMGSILLRNLIINEQFQYNKIILLGTFNPSYLKVRIGLIFQNILMLFSKNNQVNKISNYLMFGVFSTLSNLKYKTKNWITNDKEQLKQYLNDPLCTKPFDNQYIKVVIQILLVAINKQAINKLDNNNTLIIVGQEDPCSNFSKEILTLQKKFKNNSNIYVIKDNKHEVLNELNKEQTYNIILQFIKRT